MRASGRCSVVGVLCVAMCVFAGRIPAQARALPVFVPGAEAGAGVPSAHALIVTPPQLPPAWRCRRGDWTVIAGATLAGAVGGWLVAALAGSPLTDDGDRRQQQRRNGLLVGGALGLGVGLVIAYTACDDERASFPLPAAPPLRGRSGGAVFAPARAAPARTG